MKNIFVLAAVMLLSCANADAQGFLNKLKGKAEVSYDVKKTADGAVYVDSVVENIPLSASAIREAAKEYLLNAYKESKYTIANEDESRNSLSAQGQFLHFHEGKLGLNQYYLTVNFVVQVDAKDNRMRVSVIADKYQGECIDMNSSKEVNDKIAEFAPVNKDNDSKKLLYGKAFPKLYDKMRLVVKELSDFVSSKVGTTIDNDNW